MHNPRLSNRLALLAAGCGLLLLSGCHFAFSQARYKATYNLTVSHAATAPIRVTSLNGDITVRRANVAEAQIKASVACISEERLANARIVAEQRDGTLVVEAAFPNGRPEGNESCSFEITLPGATGVELHTHNGSLTLAGLAGSASLKTSNGGIEVDAHDGPLQAHTSNGQISLAQVKGRVDATSANGAVLARLSDDNPGPASLRTSNGDVKLHVGRAFTGRVNVSTSIGSVHVDKFANLKQTFLKDKSGHVIIGDGTGTSELHTSIGEIELLGPQR